MKKLTLLSIKFVGAMLDKLFTHYKRGKSGWEVMSLSEIKVKMYASIDTHDWVSVANYAMFAWWATEIREEE